MGFGRKEGREDEGCEEEVPEVVGSDLSFEAFVCASEVGELSDCCVVDEGVDRET